MALPLNYYENMFYIESSGVDITVSMMDDKAAIPEGEETKEEPDTAEISEGQETQEEPESAEIPEGQEWQEEPHVRKLLLIYLMPY